jgi:hypothetical protein
MKKNFSAPLIVGGISILIAVLPLIPTLVAGMIAKANHCVLHEGSPNPCVLLGIDIGSLLYVMGISFWLFFLTAPAGAIGLLVSLVWLAFALVRAKQVS